MAIIEELILLNRISNFQSASTERIRSIVSSVCEENGQFGRSFSDNFQHDAGEFLISMFEHMFKDSNVSNNIDENLFGGLYQEKIICECGNLTELPIQRLSEILSIQLKGPTMQSCITDFFSEEEIRYNCTKCQRKKATKHIEIVTEPSTLIIQLKRYEYDTEKRKAIKKQ